MKTIYEFLVWDNCRNNCAFCFQRKSPRNFDLQVQEGICTSVIRYLNSDKYSPGNNVLIVGGELFDDIRRKKFLYCFFEMITNLMKSNYIDLLYLNTNLIYDFECLNFVKSVIELFTIKGVLNRLKFTTSFDLNGRFKTEEDRNLFLSNLTELSSIEGLKTVTNVILTKDVCNGILENKFNIFDFEKSNNTKINLIPYIVLDRNLSADRSTIFKCLSKLDAENPDFIKSFIFEHDMKQKRILLSSNKDFSFEEKTCENSNCGHSINFKKYSTAGSCFVCDIKTLFSKYF